MKKLFLLVIIMTTFSAKFCLASDEKTNSSLFFPPIGSMDGAPVFEWQGPYSDPQSAGILTCNEEEQWCCSWIGDVVIINGISASYNIITTASNYDENNPQSSYIKIVRD